MMLLRRIVILIFILMILLLPGNSQSLNHLVEISGLHITILDGEWFVSGAYNPSDKSNSNIKDNWKQLPHNVPWLGFNNSFKNTIWFKTAFVIKKPVKDLALFISQHYRGARIYINNNLVCETRPFSRELQTKKIAGASSVIAIPDLFLKQGENVLTIRTGFLNDYSGFYEKILIGPKNKLHHRWISHILWYSMLASIILFLTIFFFLIYWNRRNEKYYLYFSALSFFFGLWIIGYEGIVFLFIDCQWAYILFSYIGSIFSPYLLLSFLYSFLEKPGNRLSRVLKIAFAALALSLVVEFTLTQEVAYYNKYLYIPFNLLTAFTVFYLAVICVKEVQKKRPFAYRIFLAVAALSFSVLISILYFIDLLEFKPILIEGFFVMTIIFASLLAARFAQVHTDLETAHSELLIVDKMKDDFMAMTSHELRTPLHGIKGVTESILDESLGPVTDEQKYNLELICRSVNWLSNLVNEILDFSRIKANKVDLYLELVSLNDLINSVVSLLKRLFEDKNVNVYVDMDELPQIMADKNKIQQVLINLIANAIKFAPLGTSAQGEVTVTAKKRRDMVSVSISDNGIGIKNDKIAKIWIPFMQLEDSGVFNKSGNGLGLGLVISKELIEMHNGKINITSEYGKGTVFEFVLPIMPDIKGIKKQQNNEEPGGSYNFKYLNNKIVPRFMGKKKPGSAEKQGMKILVVDDDPINLQVIISVCTSAGYEIITAETGAEALKIISSDTPDVILLDVMLPGINGFDVSEKIRTRYKERFIPIIMLTALNALSDILKGFNSGANDYLVKPFNRDELLARIENQLKIKYMHEKEKELNSELNIYKKIVSSSNDQMAFIDRNYSLLAINDAFLTIIEKKREDLINAHFDILFKETNINKKIKNHCDRCLKGEIVSFEKWIEINDYQERYMVFTFYPHYEDLTDINGIVLNLRDLTDRVSIERAMVNISENERRKIGMELHDGLSHYLLGIAIKARLLAEITTSNLPGEAEKVFEIENLIKNSIQKTREIARGLFPVNLSSSDLFELLDEIMNDLEKNHNIKTEIVIDRDIKIDDVIVKTQLYYIIQEAVTNIIKHAQARTVTIKLYRDNENFIVLCVQDDGIGIPEENQQRKGIGMQIMMARARMIGMSIEVQNSHSGGAHIIGKLNYSKK